MIDVNQCDAEFIIDAKLILHVENSEIRYTINRVPATRKHYEQHQVDYAAYMDDLYKAVFLAYVDGQIAGQIILYKYWNNYAYIEDIAVDVKYRRMGVGRQLMSQARLWAQEHTLAGIMLETQDNNVSACKFYESCGFRLRGFDTYLYKGLNRDIDEVALFWYMVFPPAPAG